MERTRRTATWLLLFALASGALGQAVITVFPTPPPCGTSPLNLASAKTALWRQCGGQLNGNPRTGRTLPSLVIDTKCKTPGDPFGDRNAAWNNFCPGCANPVGCRDKDPAANDVVTCPCEAMGFDFDLQRIYQLTRVRIYGNDQSRFVCGQWRVWSSQNSSGPMQEIGTAKFCKRRAWFTQEILDVAARFVRVVIYVPMGANRTNEEGCEVDEIEILGRKYIPPSPPPTVPPPATRIVVGAFQVFTIEAERTYTRASTTAGADNSAVRDMQCRSFTECSAVDVEDLPTPIYADVENAGVFDVPRGERRTVKGDFEQVDASSIIDLQYRIDVQGPLMYVSGRLTLRGELHVSLPFLPSAGETVQAIGVCCVAAGEPLLTGDFDKVLVRAQRLEFGPDGQQVAGNEDDVRDQCHTAVTERITNDQFRSVYALRVVSIAPGGEACDITMVADTDDDGSYSALAVAVDNDPGVMALIVIGAILGVCVLAMCVALGVWFTRRQKKQSKGRRTMSARTMSSRTHSSMVMNARPDSATMQRVHRASGRRSSLRKRSRGNLRDDVSMHSLRRSKRDSRLMSSPSSAHLKHESGGGGSSGGSRVQQRTWSEVPSQQNLLTYGSIRTQSSIGSGSKRQQQATGPPTLNTYGAATRAMPPLAHGTSNTMLRVPGAHGGGSHRSAAILAQATQQQQQLQQIQQQRAASDRPRAGTGGLPMGPTYRAQPQLNRPQPMLGGAGVEARRGRAATDEPEMMRNVTPARPMPTLVPGR